MESIVKIRDFAYPLNDPRHWGLAPPQEDTPPNSDLGNEDESEYSDEDGGENDWTTSSEEESRQLEAGSAPGDNSGTVELLGQPSNGLKKRDGGVGVEATSLDSATIPQLDEDNDDVIRSEGRKDATESTQWFFGTVSKDQVADERQLLADKVTFEALTLKDTRQAKAGETNLSDMFAKFSIDVLDVLGLTMNNQDLAAVNCSPKSSEPTPTEATFPEASFDQASPKKHICFRRASVQYEFRKVSDWEMNVNEGEHILVALLNAQETEGEVQSLDNSAACPPRNTDTAASGTSEDGKTPKSAAKDSNVCGSSKRSPAKADREASIDDLSEINSYHKGKLHALRSMGSLLNVLYSDNLSKVSSLTLSALELGLSRHSCFLSPYKSDLARSFVKGKHADLTKFLPLEKSGAVSKSADCLAESSSSSSSPLGLRDESPVSVKSPTPIPQRRSSLNGPLIPQVRPCSFSQMTLDSDTLEGAKLQIEEVDIPALLFHSQIQWDIKLQPNKPEKLRKHLLEYMTYQKEYGDGWITALKVSWKWRICRFNSDTAPQLSTANLEGNPLSGEKFHPEYIIKARIKISEMGLVPGNYIHTY